MLEDIVERVEREWISSLERVLLAKASSAFDEDAFRRQTSYDLRNVIIHAIALGATNIDHLLDTKH